MKIRIKICVLLGAIFAIFACTHNHKAEIISQSETLMQDQPDSSLRLLQTIDRHTLRGATLARYALIYSISQDKSGIDVTSDSLLRIAYEYYSQHSQDSLYARSQYYMGKYLSLIDQKDSAYNCLLRARTASEDSKDYYTAYLATDRMRRIAEVSDSVLCLKLAKEAYYFYVKHGVTNPANETYLLIGIGESYRRRRDKDSTLFYYNKALGKAKLSGDSVAIGSVFQNIAFHFLHYKQYDTALEYANKSLSYQKSYNRSLLKLMALCYIEKTEYDIAQQYINALPSTGSKETQLVRLGMQHRLSSKMGDADAAQTCFNSACDVAAEMYLTTLKDKLELHHKNMQEEMQRQQAENQRTIFVICFIFSVVLTMFISWLFAKYRLTSKKEKAYKEHLMEQTRSYVKKIVGIQQKLEEKKDGKRRLLLDSKDWDEIEAYLDACDNAFVTRFKEKFPTLSEKDYHLCLLLRYGFTNPDLEMVYFISSQGIKNRQRLIKEKLDIDEKELSLRQFVQRF